MGNQDWVGIVFGLVLLGALYFLFQTWYITIPIGLGLFGYYAWKNGAKHQEQLADDKNQKLYAEALKRIPQKEEGKENWEEFAHNIYDAIPNSNKVTDEVWKGIFYCVVELYEMEPFEAPSIPKPPPIADSMEGARYRDKLSDVLAKYGDTTARKIAEKVIAETFEWFIDEMPRMSQDGEVIATVPLVQSFQSGEAINRLIHCFIDPELKEHNLYKGLRDQLHRNLYEASGYDWEKDNPGNDKLTFPNEYEGEDIAEAYLKKTPFQKVLETPVSFCVPDHIAYEHTVVVGGSGHGKTTALQKMIMGRIEKAKAGEGGFAVIDPKGLLIDLIARQQCFSPDGGELTDKIIIIDPKRDLEHPPCLNMFDLGIDELKNLSKADRMGVKNNALDLIDYMFSDLLHVETTGRQQVAFKMVGELLMSIPDANIMTLLDFLNNPNDYQKYIDKLAKTPRDYIQTQFVDVRFDTTRKALAERVFGILTLPMMEAMLDNKKNKVNLVEAINEGKVLLIKADENFLSTSGARVFGGIWIALLFQAALSRVNIPKEKRLGFTIFIDEASMFFSDRLRQLLIKAREYKLGVVFAFQDLDQIESKQMRASVMGSTSTKMVGGLNASDRRAFAQEMNCSDEFLKTPRKNEEALTTEFATYIRGVTETPMLLTFPIGKMDNEPQMSESEFQRLVEVNRSRIARSDDELINEVVGEEVPCDKVDEEEAEAPETTDEIKVDNRKSTRWSTVDYKED